MALQAMCMILTVGYSTNEAEAFVRLLERHDVRRLLDVRRIPRSGRYPHFNDAALAAVLARAGIAYAHLLALGGRRKPAPGSTNTGWRIAGFQGFADHMQTPEFDRALASVLEMAARERVALMCAEAAPWRCHRSLIADALVARGARVEHILPGDRREAHSLRPWARVVEGRVTYAALRTSLFSGAVAATPGPPGRSRHELGRRAGR